MSALAQLEDRIAKLEAAAEEIRELTRAAHEVTKDLRAAIREAQGIDLKRWIMLIEGTLDATMYAAIGGYVAEKVPALHDVADMWRSRFEETERLVDEHMSEIEKQIELARELHHKAGRLIVRLEGIKP